MVGGPGGGFGGPDAAANADAGVVFQTCRDQTGVQRDGNHNEGQDCLQGGCHALGGDGPLWTVAGTLYTDALGTAPKVGAIVTIRDANGTIIDMISATNGNFWTSTPVQFPLETFTSECPNLRPMVSQSAVGGCNMAGCHDLGSASGRINLP
jgi:hypothetical protein